MLNTVRSWGTRLSEAVRLGVTDSRSKILAAVASGWLLALGVRGIYPALLPYISQSYGISLTASGTLLSVLWVMYAFGQLPGGVLADWIGERNILLLSGAVTTLGVLVIVLPYDVRILYAGTVLLGMGAGLYGTTRLTILSDTYPDNDGTVIGISSATGHVGSSALPIVASFIAGAIGWVYGFLYVVPLFGLTLVGLWLFVPVSTSTTADGNELSVDVVRRLVSALSNATIFLTVLLMLCMSIVFQSFASFYPTYLVTQKGMSEMDAAILYGIFFGLAIIVQPIAGVVSDRFNIKYALYIIFGATGVSIWTIVVTSVPSVLVALSVVASVQLGFWPVIYPYLISYLPAELQGSGLGLLRFGYMVIAAGGPVVVGLLADNGLFDESFLLLGLIAIGSLAFCFVLPTTHR